MKAAAKSAASYLHRLVHSPPKSLPKPPILQFFSSSPNEESSSSSSSSSPPAENAEELFRRWRFGDADITYLRSHRPSLLRSSPSLLRPKLHLLSSLSLSSPSDLLRLIHLRPRLLLSSLPSSPPPLLLSLFPSPSLLRNALLRNPSLLTSPLLPSTLSLYASLGVPPSALAPLLLSRPTILPRSHISHDKLTILRLSGLPNHSKLYKYALAVLAVSKIATLMTKICNLQRFGLSQEQVLTQIFARSPYVLTLSVDKVQRNMTYITAMMKLPADTVLLEPQLLHYNLEAVLKPRHMVLARLRETGLCSDVEGVKGVLRAMRMKEARFINAFITCRKEDGVAEGLLEFYNEVKKSKRLADSARKVVHKGFPY